MIAGKGATPAFMELKMAESIPIFLIKAHNPTGMAIEKSGR